MIETVKGFSDYTGEEALKREKIQKIVEETFKLYGFEPAETPIIEQEDFVRGTNEQDEAVSDIFKLKDRGGRALALRYEFTFQLKRIANNKKLPYKRYQIGPVFRDEPVTGNRSRQFTQCDIDTVGSTVKEEAEVLAATSRLLEKLGIKFIININNRQLMNELLEEQGISKDKEAIIREIDKLDKLTEEEVKNNLKKFKAEKLIEIFKKPADYFKKYRSYSEIEELKECCKAYNVKVNFLPSLARGLSYYNGSVFEVKSQEMKETICGGGSFKVNGIQATGISQSIERLSKLSKIMGEKPKAIIISINQYKKAIQLATLLRESNISCLILDKVSKGLEYANSQSIPFVVFIGEDEVKKKKFKLRDMKTGKESLLSEEGLIKILS